MPSVECGDSSSASVGSRVESAGDYGTIKFIGEVPPTKGLWLGVEWDDTSRGKHDGTFEGVQYFKTRWPTSGSFVRPTKVNLGVSCPDAIRQRYGEVKDDDTAGINRENLAMCRKNINAPFLEVVGFDKVNKKQSQFHTIRVVCLRGHQVNGSGPAGELQSLSPRIRELDLSNNLVSSWQAVAEITGQLKHLRFLNLSNNRLTLPASPAALRECFQSVRHAVIGGMDYTWAEVVSVSAVWPDVEGLQVPFNNISSLDCPPPGILSKLTYLDLEGNKILDWGEINKLGSLLNLETLNLSDISVSDIRFPEGSTPGKTDLFPALKSLNLVRNNIASWVSVCQLHLLKRLSLLRFTANPVLELESAETCRQLVIAAVGTLELLNGVPVTAQERKGAEYDYLKKQGKEWLALDKGDEGAVGRFHRQYPRYAFLVDKYGAPEEGEMRIQSNLIVDNLISIEIFSPESLGPARVKKLLPTMIVQKVSGYAQRLFDTGNKIPVLAYISSKNPGIEVPLDNDLKQLSFYSIEDGDRISVRW